MTDYERGFAAGVEAAAKVAERNEYDGYGSHVAACIRALSQPREPTPSPAAPREDDGSSMDCSCGRVTLDWFTKEHSKLTKEGDRFISTNHRRDRCDREEVTPSPSAPREGG